MKLVHVVSSLAGGPGRVLTDVAISAPVGVHTKILVLSDAYKEDILLRTLTNKGYEVLFFSRNHRFDIGLLWNIFKTIRLEKPK